MKLSIVIPNYNGEKLLKTNLPKVIKASRNAEVIIVDDASTDKSTDYIKKNFPNIKLIENKNNLGFALACNVGVNQAKGDIVVLLNSDVAPQEDFLQYLIPYFKNENIFAVGCLEIEGDVTRGKSTGRFVKGMFEHQDAKNREPGISLWAFAASAAYSREKWLKLGGMDPLFKPAYWEDIDISWRAWKRGWQVLFEPKSKVYHQAESTNIKIFGRKQMEIMSIKNQFLFIWKNIHDKTMIFSHIFVLPIFLTKALLSGNKQYIIGIYKALCQFPQAMIEKIQEKNFIKVTDSEILKRFKTDIDE